MVVREADMTFEDICADRDQFLTLYHVEKEFRENGFSWTELMRIGEDFEKKRSVGGEYFNIIQRYIAQIACFDFVHSYRFRIKRTGSLLAKILRKCGDREEAITVDNYFREISDLLGIRILYIFKEDYWPVHVQLMKAYKEQLVEDIKLKLKTGDDEEMYRRLLDKYNNVKPEYNKMYRSIHYTINANTDNILKSPKLEIQTRTIFEEGWSEINHQLVYKKGECITPGLNKTSRVLSELVGTCDLIGGLMKDLYDVGLHRESGAEGQDGASIAGPLGEVIRKFLEG